MPEVAALGQAVQELREVVASLVVKVDAQGALGIEIGAELRNLQEQLRSLARAIEGNGQPGLRESSTRMRVELDQLHRSHRELASKVEAQASAATMSKTQLLVGVLGLLGTAIVAAAGLVAALVK